MIFLAGNPSQKKDFGPFGVSGEKIGNRSLTLVNKRSPVIRMGLLESELGFLKRCCARLTLQDASIKIEHKRLCLILSDRTSHRFRHHSLLEDGPFYSSFYNLDYRHCFVTVPASVF